MTNNEKYKTPDERIQAFNKKCGPCEVVNCDRIKAIDCYSKWLDIEADEDKPEPCPFCGSSVELRWHNEQDCLVCHNGHCGYVSGKKQTEAEAIAAHNRVCRAVEAAKKCVEMAKERNENNTIVNLISCILRGDAGKDVE